MLRNFLRNKWWTYLWLKSEWLLVLIIIINIMFSAIAGYFTPKLITSFYESLNGSDFNTQLRFLIFLFLGEYFNRFLFTLCTHRYIQKLLSHVRTESFSKWLKAPLKKGSEKSDQYPLGEVLARLMNDTDAVREVVSSGSFAIFIDIIFIVSCLISFLQLNSLAGVALFISEVLACILLIRGSKAMSKIFMEVRRITGQMARVVTDLTSGLTELFFSPNKKYASKRGERIFEEFLDKQLKANIWDASYYSAAESLYPILIALVMIIFPYSQIVEVAILAALIDLIQKSITPIKDVASKISVLARAGTGIERIHQFNLMFSSNSGTDYPFAKELKVGSLNFNLTHFQYDQGFQLKDIQFKLKKGDSLGILGESGCGKSTLLKLLSGQYQIFKGRIFLDDVPFNPADESELKKFSQYISLISQESHVFTETLEFNITLGEVQGFENFWEVALTSIPYLKKWGLNPKDKVNPKDLSMGQKQLLSGLRALFLKKPIILMDEISSGLDSELELALRDLIRFFQSQSITIIVTHRLETILQAHSLIVMDQGCQIAVGNHQTLKNVPQYKEFMDHLV